MEGLSTLISFLSVCTKNFRVSKYDCNDLIFKTPIISPHFMFKCNNHPDSLFFFLNLAILIILGHLFSFVCPYILPNGQCQVEYFSNTDTLFKKFLTGSVLGPLIETAFFQALPLALFYKFVRKKSNLKLNTLIFSISLLFGITHNYNVLTIIDAIFAGIIFCRVYVYFINRGKSGFLYTFFIHAIFNTYAFIVDDVLRIT